MKDVLTYKNSSENKIPFIRGKTLAEIRKIKYNTPRYRSDKINYFEENPENNSIKN